MMSYSTQFYVVEIERLKSAFGSKDDALLRATVRDQAAEIESNSEWFQPEINEEGAPRVEQALAEIIRGSVNVPEDCEFQYGYALELLCMQLGERVKEAGDVCFLHELPFGRKLLDGRAPVSIPPSPDFPEIGHLLAADVFCELVRVREAIADGDHQYDCEQYLRVLEKAYAAGKGIVSFTY
jgi:hypothetical protein